MDSSRRTSISHASSDRLPRRPVGHSREVLFLGGVFPRDEEAAIVARSRGPIQNAANALQWTLIQGCDQELGSPVSILNAVFVGSYPRLYSDSWVSGRNWSHAPGASDESIGFLNVFGIKHVWRLISLVIKALRLGKVGQVPRRRSVVVYSLHTPLIAAAIVMKHIDPALAVCVVVPDLPEYMNLNKGYSGALRVLKRVDRWLMEKLLRKVDGFVLLTRHMIEALSVAGRPWIVMEGAVNPAEVENLGNVPAPQSEEKVILYSGTLQMAYGILDLLESFALLPDSTYRLWICGAGEAERLVREAAKRDPRVHYLGQVTRLKVLSLQRQATVLVNPRGDAEVFTKYSFPSKIMEYLLSGTPVVVRRLPGIPDEYSEYLSIVDGTSPAALAEKIAEVCAMSSERRSESGQRARQFVLERKSGSAQARRILELLDEIHRSREVAAADES